jgi:predicted MPP superfamily phosphohydrolase
MPAHGRGEFYTRKRGALEWAAGQVWRGGWAPRLMHRVGLGPKVRVVHEPIAIDRARWPAGVKPLRVGFVSDLHAGPTTHPGLIREAIARVRALAPDVVLLGGDYVYLDVTHLEVIAREVETIEAPLGRFAVMGNHDLWADDGVIQARLEGAGARVLVNAPAHLPAPYDFVSVCGMDDPWTGIRDPKRAFDGARDVRIVLVHSPRALELVGDERFDVMVCGHTHGGHIALPGPTPIVAVGGRAHQFGRRDVGRGRTLVVSRGIGATEVPLRTFADPDVVSLTLGALGTS